MKTSHIKKREGLVEIMKLTYKTLYKNKNWLVK